MPKFIKMITVYNPHHQSITIRGNLIQPGNSVQVKAYDTSTDTNFIKALRKSGLIVTLTNHVQPEVTNSFKIGEQAAKVVKSTSIKKQNNSVKSASSTSIINNNDKANKTSSQSITVNNKTSQDNPKSETSRKKPGPKPKAAKVESSDISKA